MSLDSRAPYIDFEIAGPFAGVPTGRKQHCSGTIQIAGTLYRQRPALRSRRAWLASAQPARAKPSAPAPPAPPTIHPPPPPPWSRHHRLRGPSGCAWHPCHGTAVQRNVAISAHAAIVARSRWAVNSALDSQEAYAGQGAYDQVAFRDSCSDDDLAFAPMPSMRGPIPA